MKQRFTKILSSLAVTVLCCASALLFGACFGGKSSPNKNGQSNEATCYYTTQGLGCELLTNEIDLAAYQTGSAWSNLESSLTYGKKYAVGQPLTAHIYLLDAYDPTTLQVFVNDTEVEWTPAADFTPATTIQNQVMHVGTVTYTPTQDDVNRYKSNIMLTVSCDFLPVEFKINTNPIDSRLRDIICLDLENEYQTLIYYFANSSLTVKANEVCNVTGSLYNTVGQQLRVSLPIASGTYSADAFSNLRATESLHHTYGLGEIDTWFNQGLAVNELNYIDLQPSDFRVRQFRLSIADSRNGLEKYLYFQIEGGDIVSISQAYKYSWDILNPLTLTFSFGRKNENPEIWTPVKELETLCTKTGLNLDNIQLKFNEKVLNRDNLNLFDCDHAGNRVSMSSWQTNVEISIVGADYTACRTSNLVLRSNEPVSLLDTGRAAMGRDTDGTYYYAMGHAIDGVILDDSFCRGGIQSSLATQNQQVRYVVTFETPAGQQLIAAKEFDFRQWDGTNLYYEIGQDGTWTALTEAEYEKLSRKYYIDADHQYVPNSLNYASERAFSGVVISRSSTTGCGFQYYNNYGAGQLTIAIIDL